MDDKRIQNIRPNLVEYIKSKFKDEIIKESRRIKVDMSAIYDTVMLIDYIEFLEEFPQAGLELLEECYKDAFYAIKTEKPNDPIFEITNLPDTFNTTNGCTPTIEDLDADMVGKLVEVEGIVTTATQKMSSLKRAVYICPSCGQKKEVFIENPFEMNFEPTCPKCAQSMGLIRPESKTVNFQELKIQQPLDLMKNPEEPPKYISVFLENTPGIYCGRIRITGVPIELQKNKRVPLYKIVLRGIHAEPVESKISINFTPEELETFKKISEDPDHISKLAQRIAPQIKGYPEAKKAVFLQQLKGVEKPGKRKDFHILWITDPAIGKTVILRNVANIPGNGYGSMTTASGVGLTASVVQDKTEIGDGVWVVKAGLLILTNGGTACVDELTVGKDAASFLLEAMESQTIHVNKGGINTKLESKSAVLAACNPKWGRFDPNISLIEQVNIPAPLLSRFDLLYVLPDEPEKNRDKEIAKHIIKTHIAHSNKDVDSELELSSTLINGVEVNDELFYKYIYYARNLTPSISDDVEQLLTDTYLEMRKGTIQITARQLEAMIRIAEAHAKARLSDTVENVDAEAAVTIMLESMKQIAFDKESGQYDIDKLGGISRKDRNAMKNIFAIIRDMYDKREEDYIFFDDIIQKCKLEGYSEETTNKTLKKLKSNGDIDEPKTGKYRII